MVRVSLLLVRLYLQYSSSNQSMMFNSLPTAPQSLDRPVDVFKTEWAADIWVLMRAWPLGTTGKEKPMT
jgi:hypothetical protein